MTSLFSNLLSHSTRYFFLTLICLTLAFSTYSAAFAKGEIAVVDIKYVLDKSTAAEGARNQIKVMRDKFLSTIKSKEEELRADEKELTKQRSILSADAFEKKKQDFIKKQTNIQRDIQEKRKKIDQSLNEALGQIQQAIHDIIKDLAKEKRFDVALPSSQVLHADESLDITKEVLVRLNKKLSKITIK